jgi:predicted ATPase
MITHIEITGFKSLVNFKTSFHKGLNVLIGPNGSGKTNICQAIGLISSLAENRLSEYILSIGGAHAAFTMKKEGIKQDETRSISVKCSGITSGITSGDQEHLVKYQYSSEIILTDHIKIQNEILSLSYLNQKNRYKKFISAEQDIEGVAKIIIHDNTFIDNKVFPFFRKGTKTYFFNIEKVAHGSSLQLLSRIMYWFYIVEKDLTGSKVYNIDPHLAKNPTDILESSIMQNNGSRMASTIYEMSKRSSDNLSEINRFISKISPNFKRIIPTIDSKGLNKSFSVEDNNGIKCTAMSLSDGTVKTIALLISILENTQGTSIIEEPENYLHPWACQSLIEYLRDHFSEKVCILTTHSETILNMIHPKEVLICNNSKSFTTVSRLTNSKSVEDAIKLSGFGCGYHYVSGALGGTPQ